MKTYYFNKFLLLFRRRYVLDLHLCGSTETCTSVSVFCFVFSKICCALNRTFFFSVSYTVSRPVTGSDRSLSIIHYLIYRVYHNILNYSIYDHCKNVKSSWYTLYIYYIWYIVILYYVFKQCQTKRWDEQVICFVPLNWNDITGKRLFFFLIILIIDGTHHVYYVIYIYI